MKFLVPIAVSATLLTSSAALAQTAPPATPATPPAATVPPKSALPANSAQTMTEQQAKAWISKSVYSSDDKNVTPMSADSSASERIA